MKIQLERQQYHYFLEDWLFGKYKGLRFGQAFYQYFKLHRLSDQKILENLYELDDKAAVDLIRKIFNFN